MLHLGLKRCVSRQVLTLLSRKILYKSDESSSTVARVAIKASFHSGCYSKQSKTSNIQPHYTLLTSQLFLFNSLHLKMVATLVEISFSLIEGPLQ